MNRFHSGSYYKIAMRMHIENADQVRKKRSRLENLPGNLLIRVSGRKIKGTN
jgi:hypothetical protein